MRGFPRLLPILLLVTGSAGTSRASTFLYTHYGPSAGEPGFFRTLTPADGTFTTYRYGDSKRFLQIYFTPSPSSTVGFGFVHLAPGSGQTLAPGVYADATTSESSTSPYLEVDLTGRCGFATGSFDVHDITLDAAGEVVAISVDFMQRCYDGTTIVGAVRFHTNDAACEGVPDGTPCDDDDPCTTGDACHAGSCDGTDAVSASCTASDDCNDAGTCDHRTGECRGIGRQYGTVCDDGNACTETSTCREGGCTGANPITCDDHSLCTTDRCDPDVGCVFDPKPGTCWVTRPEVRAVATASANGRNVRCSLRCQAPGVWTLIVQDDGTYLSPNGIATCPTGQVVFPDEIGAVRPARRRLLLEPSNLDELRAATLACNGSRLRSYRTWAKGPLDGPTLEVQNLNRVRGPGPRIVVHATTRTIGHFVRGISPSGAVVPPLTHAGLPTCEPDLRPRCVVD